MITCPTEMAYSAVAHWTVEKVKSCKTCSPKLAGSHRRGGRIMTRPWCSHTCAHGSRATHGYGRLTMAQTTPACMTWEKLVAAFNKDTGHRCWIRRGFQLPRTCSPSVEPYVRWSRSKELSVQDEVPMLWGKPVIPVCLRQQVLRTLHSARSPGSDRHVARGRAGGFLGRAD